MTQAKSVHSTPRRTAPLRKAPPTKKSTSSRPASPAIDPTTLPDEYCLCLQGDCLEPLIPDGSAVKLKKSENYGVGDVVCIWFKPEAIPPGANPAWLKRVSRNAPHWVKQYPYADHPGSEVAAMMIVEQLNPRIRYTITCSDILAIHKAVGYSSTDAKIGGTVSAKGMLSIGGRA